MPAKPTKVSLFCPDVRRYLITAVTAGIYLYCSCSLMWNIYVRVPFCVWLRKSAMLGDKSSFLCMRDKDSWWFGSFELCFKEKQVDPVVAVRRIDQGGTRDNVLSRERYMVKTSRLVCGLVPSGWKWRALLSATWIKVGSGVVDYLLAKNKL